MRGLEIDRPFQEYTWRGKPVVAEFRVFIPSRVRPRRAAGLVTVSKGEVPIGHVGFALQIVSRKEKPKLATPPSAELLGTLSRYREAFLSYASEDRVRVVQGAQMLAGAKINFFQDILSLDPGDRWKQQLYKHIDSCDVFFLFWSTAAKKSVWVRKETRYARRRQAGKEDAPPVIVPILIEGPPPVKPPRSLSFLHFNDKYLYLTKGAEAEAQARRKGRV